MVAVDAYNPLASLVLLLDVVSVGLAVITVFFIISFFNEVASLFLVTLTLYIFSLPSSAITLIGSVLTPTDKSFVPSPLTFDLLLVAVAFNVTLDILFLTLQLYSVVALLNAGSNVQSDTVILSNVLVVSKLSVITFPSA